MSSGFDRFGNSGDQQPQEPAPPQYLSNAWAPQPVANPFTIESKPSWMTGAFDMPSWGLSATGDRQLQQHELQAPPPLRENPAYAEWLRRQQQQTPSVPDYFKKMPVQAPKYYGDEHPYYKGRTE